VALGVEESDVGMVERALSVHVGPDRRFVSASLYRVGETEPVWVLGEEPSLLARPDAEVRAFLTHSIEADGVVVKDLLEGEQPRLGYGYSGPTEPTRFVVYAEQALPPDRTAEVERGSAFSGLEYALYLGTDETMDQLIFASSPELPLEGRRGTEEVALGDQTLLLVMAPTEEMGGPLLARLPWIALALGSLMALSAAALVEMVQRRRRDAERLAAENLLLYDEQRQGSIALQHSLLPLRIPDVAGLQIGTAYAAGTAGTEVGGDWYDVVDQGDRVLVVVGDVSGRGLDAASVMSSIRHGMRALAPDCDRPEELLGKIDRLDPDERRGHFATVLCGFVDVAEGTIAFGNAGHPPPLIVSEAGAAYLEVPPGPPIGATRGASYSAHTVGVPRGATVLLVTDGLFERRGEPIDAGMERLRAAAAEVIGRGGSVQEDLDELMARMTGGRAADDAAILGMRRT
jgi:serine phosphatase RsbU (regulator of sigma subunit)